MGMIIVNIIMYFLYIQDISRLLMGIFLILNIALLTLSKFIVFKILEKVRADGFNTRNILVIGSKERARRVIKIVEKHKTTGYRIMGCFDVDEDQLGQMVVNWHKVIGLVKDLEDYLRNNIVDELIFAMPLKKLEKGDRYIVLAESMGIKVRIIPDWQIHYLMYMPDIATIRFEDFLGVYTMALQSTPHNEGKMLIKHVGDFAVSLILIILLLPFFVVFGFAIKLYSKGPVFYKQERLGMNGRKFVLYKFRTMVNNADNMLKKLDKMNEADGLYLK